MNMESAPSKTGLERNSSPALIGQAARSFKWSILYNTIPRLVTPFSTMILAAILTPADFGLVAISTFVIALGRVVVDLGLGKTVIQRQTHIHESASVGLWVSMLISAGLYAILWITAPRLALAYDTTQVVGVIRVSAIALPLYALMTIPKALLQRDMQFSHLFWVNISFLIVQAIMSVILAFLGSGYWSMIWGQLIGLGASVVLAWRLGNWRPSITSDWSLLRPMLGFSVWVMLSGFQNWLNLYADNAIAGLFLGVRSLGIYALGFNVATLIPTFLVASLDDVAYPTFCRLQENPREVGQALIKLQHLTAAVLFPLVLGLAATAGPLIHLLYGNKWAELGWVISILAILPGLVPIWSINQNAYQAIGNPALWTKLAGISLLFLIPLLWVVAPFGLIAFVLARFAGSLLLPLGNIFIGARHLGLNVGAQIRILSFPFWISLLMFGLVTLLVRFLSPFESWLGWVKLLSISLTGAITYLTLIRTFDRALWNQLYTNIRRVLS